MPEIAPTLSNATAGLIRSVPASAGISSVYVAKDLQPASISLAELLSALSFALDLTEDVRPGHAVRSCLLGMRIAAELGLSESQRSTLYYSLLLKDFGCSCNCKFLCEMVGGDDRAIKRKVKLADWQYPSITGLRTLWEHAGVGEPLLEKSGRVLRLAFGRHSFRRELVRLRCECAARLIPRIGLACSVADVLASLDEHWNGQGYPDRLRGESIPVASRIINLAQCLDLFASESSTAGAVDRVRRRTGSWFDPNLVRVVVLLAAQGRLWNHYGSGMERRLVLDLEPGVAVQAGNRQIDDIAETFAQMIDAKSPFTGGHSQAVRDAAVHIAEQMGLSEERTRLISRAALLHDIGKLRVPNSILDKPGKLDVIEWQVVKEHPGLGGEILGRIRSFKELSHIVAEHHEKLDGSGYPAGLKAEQLCLESRILAVADAYSALLENRSYRKAMPHQQALEAMERYLPSKLDRNCCAPLFGSVAASLPFAQRDLSQEQRDIYA
jgi:putative nucleotidyltransferase with HDIG domain